jgi:signal transduction histidine kinase/CheY-like chemotaxis protein
VANRPGNPDRLLLLTPTGRDAELATRALERAGLHAEACATFEQLCDEIVEGAGAALITQEALVPRAMACLREVIERQPAWSDFPLLIFTSQPAAEATAHSFDVIGPHANITFIERPIRVKTMISSVQTALRARRRQYEVRDLLHEQQRRVEERDQFLAMLSHELRNPLAAISLALSDLNGDGGTHEREILVRQTRHLTKLVDDLLDIGRITSGKIMLHRSTLDLVDIIEHCIEACRPRIQQRGLTLRTDLRAPRAVISGDPVRLEQVVNNLLSNAIKYTPAGGTIDVILEEECGESVLRVRDTGKGIPQELLQSIFDLFMQDDVALDRSEGGMGIGLTLVRKLVELHGGRVRAQSDGRGRGSEFIVRLPLATAPAVRDVPRRPTAPPPPAMPRHILVVEDNADVRALLHAKLRQLGHAVEVAEDGVTAVEKVIESHPDVALVDIGLPGIDGYEVARRVRAALGTDIYLVALTGYGQSDDRARALAAGFNVHLTKPADLEDLQGVLAGMA